MIRSRLLATLLLAVPLLSARAFPQCPVGPTFLAYGTACSPSGIGSPPPSLAASFDPATCSVTLTITVFPFFSYLVSGQWLFFGLQSANVPFPLWSPCLLLVAPAIAVPLPTPFPPSGGSTPFSIPIPNDPALAGAQAYAQGIVRRTHSLFPVSHFEQTAGLSITL
jgi:hypothetical protein